MATAQHRGAALKFALGLLLVMCAATAVWSATADIEKAAAVSGIVATFLAFFALAIELATRIWPGERNRPAIADLADDLAEAIGDQLRSDMQIRLLRGNGVLPMNWTAT